MFVHRSTIFYAFETTVTCGTWMMRHVEKEHKAMDWRPGVIEELLEGVVDFFLCSKMF